VTDPSVPAVIEMVDLALRSYFQTPASEPKLTNPDEVHETITGLKVSKAPGPNGIPNRASKHLLQRAVSLLVRIFKVIVLTHHFPSLWQYARVISILKLRKDPALPSSYRPISLSDAIGMLFEKIFLARILHEVSKRGLMRDEQFGYRPRHIKSLQLARLVQRITRNVGEKRLTDAVFSRRGQSLRYCLDRWPPLQANTPQLPVLHSPYSLIIPPGPDVRSVLPDGHVISWWHECRGGSGWIDLPCPLQSVCQRHALALAARRVSSLRGRHGHHSHVPQADTARPLPGIITQRTSTVVE